MRQPLFALALATSASALSATALAQDAFLSVRIENLAPQRGTFLTPVWVGFHNGSFDLYNSGEPAASFLERIAEDGDTAPLAQAFADSGAGLVDRTIASGNIPPIEPGESTRAFFRLDRNDPTSTYFSYASMVIPSNDAFIANGNPMAFRLFDDQGNFLGADFTVLGSMVLDAGTEVNDEIPENTAFFGQMAPDTGVDENGVVRLHEGFLRPGSGGILDDDRFANADFIQDGYQVARITITEVPAPGAAGVLTLGALAAARRRR